ncbi:MAG: hypothetical protein KJZ64_06145 [Sphingomonadaceae bacterium]|nr:hypothetical protein [Sphingomonadaceae bacterium]
MATDSTGPAQLRFGFAEEKPTQESWLPNPDDVREDALAILASARAVTADNLWDQRTLRYNKVVFPNMTKWLPDDEREQLCFAFFREVERIELLMAA